MTRATLLLALGSFAACEGILPPLRGELDVGHDAYAVFVGGPDRASDLYAVARSGGTVLPITYTAVAELNPSLAPDGGHVAFLRAASLRDSLPGTAWVLDLRTGSERQLELPKGAGPPREIGWSPDGAAVFVATDRNLYRFAAPPALADEDPRPVPPNERAAAESSLSVLLGNPVFAKVIGCDNGRALCVVGDTGTPALLVRDARDPARWGPDSVAYFVGDRLEIRPLGPGRARPLTWSNPPPRPRAITFFPGR